LSTTEVILDKRVNLHNEDVSDFVSDSIRIYESTIQLLKSQLEQAKQGNLETIEETLCASCKRSMEESLLGDTYREREMDGIHEMTKKMDSQR
jgi:hypothetical protein